MDQELQARLSAPFPLGNVHVKVQAMSRDKSKGLMVAYVDARDVMDRLDDVAGPGAWYDEYVELLSEKACTLKCRLTVAGVTKEDVGIGPDYKEACSDALKRAAVKFGVGRYLYRSDQVWVDLDDRQRPKPKEADILRRMGLIERGSASRPNGHAEQSAAPEVPMSALQAMCGHVGFTPDQRDVRLKLAVPLVGREVASFKELSDAERLRLYKILRAIKDRYASGVDAVDLQRRRAACDYLIQTGAFIKDRADLRRILTMFDQEFWSETA